MHKYDMIALWKVIDEMISTEEAYIQGLTKLITYFVYPLQGMHYIDEVLQPKPKP